MVGKKPRVAVSGERDALGDSPFAALGSVATGDTLPAADPARPKAPAPPPWRVRKTQKGGWPVRVEKRPGGKTATVIERVEGDANALCATLKKRFATGGAAKDGVVELQGEHVKVVSDFLASS